MSESITNTADAVAALGALPMPVGTHVPPWPPAPRDFEEKLRQDVARLQGLLAEAVAAKHLADRERDLMRERVSEPFGCKYCGAEKRWHGRRSISGAGVHGWERPTDGQVKARMLARRAARLALDVAHDAGRRERYAKALYEFVNGAFVWEACDDGASWLEEADAAIVVADAEQAEWRDRVDEVERRYIVDTAELKRRIAELEAERHTTNDALDDAVQALRAMRAAPAAGKPKDARACANCGSAPELWCPDCAACQRGCYGGFKDNPCTHPNAGWPKSGPSVERSADRLTQFFAPVAALREDDPNGLRHSYRVGRDLPESGGV